MRVLVMGAGAIGGYYGALLAEHGHDVTFVARGAHLAALREFGLELRRDGQAKRQYPVQAIASPADVPQHQGGFDLVLFTVKTYDTIAAATALRPVIGTKTTVLTLQNGVDSAAELSAVLGAERVLAGTTLVATTLVAPGIIERTSPFQKITLGEQDGTVTLRVETIAAALRAADIEAVVSSDPQRAVWEKFIVLAPHASITSACQSPVGPIRETPEGAMLYRTLIAEAVAVGHASGVALTADAVEATVALVMSVPPTLKTSMQHDYERGHRVELEHLTGAVVRRGRALGVPTPAFDPLYAILKVRALTCGGQAEGVPVAR